MTYVPHSENNAWESLIRDVASDLFAEGKTNGELAQKPRLVSMLRGLANAGQPAEHLLAPGSAFLADPATAADVTSTSRESARAFAESVAAMAAVPDVANLPMDSLHGPVSGLLKRAVNRTLKFVLEAQARWNRLFVTSLNAALGAMRSLAEDDARLGEQIGLVVGALHRLQSTVLGLRERSGATDAAVAEISAAAAREVSVVRAEIAAAGHASDERLAEFEKRLEALRFALATKISGGAHASGRAVDFDYFAFENAFRGSPETIAARQALYVGVLSPIHPGPVIDVGCGRGELVHLLANASFQVRGVDSNLAMIEACRARGLAVTHADAVQFLAGEADASQGAIVGSHIAEHFAVGELRDLLALAFRKLRVGGFFCLETPNPTSWSGFHWYLTDPTHRLPLPPDLLAFLVRDAGFEIAEVRMLSPCAPERALKSEGLDGILRENFEKLSEQIFGFQDYAVIARRPAAS